jgi:anti-sigma factor ChrR (cupin superfamily)
MRCAAGLRFPRHRHVGHELSLLLEGTIQEEDSGTIYHPGDLLRMAPGSEHAFFVLPPRDCVLALLLEESWPQFTGG